jgi:hypothetical protein
VDLVEGYRIAGARRIWWNLAELPQGQQTFNGVRFEIGSGVVQLASQEHLRLFEGHFPTNVSGIKVGRKSPVLHFLYCSIASRRQLLAKYVIRFANGQTWEIPVGAQDVDAFTGDSDPHNAKRALLARLVPIAHGSERVLQSAWENPLPDEEIKAIDYVSEMSWDATALLAITLE